MASELNDAPGLVSDSEHEENEPPVKIKKVYNSKRVKNYALRMRGQKYKGVSKTVVGDKASYKQATDRKERKMKERCDQKKCEQTRKCHEISDEHRQSIFNKFWNDFDWTAKKV